MILLTNNGGLLLKYQQKLTTKNKKYNYKELTIPSDIYNFWTQRNNNQPVTEVTLMSKEVGQDILTYITPHIENHPPKFDLTVYAAATLKIRINKSKPNKEGKQKHKATMTIRKEIYITNDIVTFLVDPFKKDFDIVTNGLCIVEGIFIPVKEKKVSKEKKTTPGDINFTSYEN